MEYFAHGDAHEGVIEEVANGAHMSGNWGWSWLGMATMIVLFVLIVLLIVKYISSNAGSKTNNHDPDAFAVLNKRYANGDITRKEFDDIKKAISSK